MRVISARWKESGNGMWNGNSSVFFFYLVSILDEKLIIHSLRRREWTSAWNELKWFEAIQIGNFDAGWILWIFLPVLSPTAFTYFGSFEKKQVICLVSRILLPAKLSRAINDLKSCITVALLHYFSVLTLSVNFHKRPSKNGSYKFIRTYPFC